MDPLQQEQASRRWKLGEPAWDIAEALGIRLRDLLVWVSEHPQDYPPLKEMSAPIETRVERRLRKKSARKMISTVAKLLPARPARPKPVTFEQLVASLDMGLIADALQVTEHEAEDAIRHLHDGGLQQALLEQLAIPYPAILQLCRHIGWTSSGWHKVGVLRGDRVGSLDKATVLEMFKSEMTLKAIGEAAGVTREYIRIICLAEGLRSRSEIRADRIQERTILRQQVRQARIAERARRRQIRDDQLALYLDVARRMWRDNASIRDIAISYNLKTNSMAWYLHAARQRLGADWFPLRTPRVNTESLSRSLLAESEELRKRWSEGEPATHIAEAFGWSLSHLQYYMEKVRKHCGYDALPRRSLEEGANNKSRKQAEKSIVKKSSKRSLENFLIPGRS